MMYFCVSNSVMYVQEFQGDVLYMMFYAVVTVLNLVACCYLLFRRGNAFAPDITPPVRLRRWTAAFFAAITLCHIWYLPTYFLTSHDDVVMGYLIGGLLDCMTVIPLLIVILFTMLQDRRRPLWPVGVMVMPLIIGRAWCVFCRSEDLLPVLFVYFLMMCIGLVVYIVRATQQYGRWLRDNYADLEHKEVWQSLVVLTVILLSFVVYSFDMGGLASEYAMEVNIIILICYLLWRVETISDLQPLSVSLEGERPGASSRGGIEGVGALLQRHCIDTQIYLQHDLTVSQLAQAIGVNRLYLSQYFSRLGMSYNVYINNLRIQHFVWMRKTDK